MLVEQERIPVVTVFLYSLNKIALVKRSSRVGTYKGEWGGFSGFVDRLPLNQAYMELKEEAGISEDQVRLHGIGVPLEVDDDANGYHWLVFPFLFRLNEGVEVHTNWEAEELRWFQRAEVNGLNSVPGLDRALSTVWPPFGSREFWDGLTGVATNRREGATELARRGMRTLGAYLETYWEHINHQGFLRAIWAFAASRPSMGVFPDLATRLLLAVDRSPTEFSVESLISEILDAVDDATHISTNYAREVLTGVERLFTLSYSESVLRSILKRGVDNGTIVVAESAPGKEGLYLAERLSDEGIDVEIVADADIASAVQATDAVLVGCDSITSDNMIQNKLYTRTAVLAAREHNIPCYAVAQTFKITPPGWPVFLERYVSPGQIGAGLNAGRAQTVFDLTPFSEFEAVFCEEGILTKNRVSEIRDTLGSAELVWGK